MNMEKRIQRILCLLGVLLVSIFVLSIKNKRCKNQANDENTPHDE